MATADKTAARVTFGQPNEQCLDIRILVGTDAYGLGLDNPNVERIYQW